MKRFISFILLVIMFITSCGISRSAEENDDKKAVIAAFEDYINAAKNEDTKKVSEYHLMWFNIWRTSQESYKYLTYKINKIELTKQKNGNGRDIKLAYVNVSLKYPDLNYTMSKFYKNKDFNSLVKGKSRLTQMEIIEKEVSSFLKSELKKNDIKYIEKEMTVKFEYFYPLKKWKIPYCSLWELPIFRLEYYIQILQSSLFRYILCHSSLIHFLKRKIFPVLLFPSVLGCFFL